MEWGLENRLSRIFQAESTRTVMLAADHGYFLGPTSKLEVPRTPLAPLLPYADALMITRGVARTSIDPAVSQRGHHGTLSRPLYIHPFS